MFNESDPTGLQSNEPGAKMDSGKILAARGVLLYFPLAIQQLSQPYLTQLDHPLDYLFNEHFQLTSKFTPLLEHYSYAFTAIAEVSMVGARKYSWAGWEQVDNGFNRYTEAMARHYLKASNESLDVDTGCLHISCATWNALARFNIALRDQYLPPKIKSIQHTTESALSYLEDFIRTSNIGNAYNNV